jgi:hypothetical protein
MVKTEISTPAKRWRSAFAVILFLLPMAAQGGQTRSLLAAECLALIPDKAFHSREGLLQLFWEGHRTGQFHGVVMERSEIAALRKGIQTLFPLTSCKRIEVGASNLILTFDRAIREPIPGTWRQASLELSPRIVFALEGDPRDPGALIFRLAEGSVDVDFGAAAKVLGMRRIQGTELAYSIDEARKKSILTLSSRRLIPRSRIRVDRTNELTTLTMDDAELGKNNQFVFSKGRAAFLGLRFELVASNAVRLGNGQVIKDPATFRQISEMIDAVVSQADEALIFEKGVESTTTVRYELEDRRISLSRGYQKPP